MTTSPAMSGLLGAKEPHGIRTTYRRPAHVQKFDNPNRIEPAAKDPDHVSKTGRCTEFPRCRPVRRIPVISVVHATQRANRAKPRQTAPNQLVDPRSLSSLPTNLSSLPTNPDPGSRRGCYDEPVWSRCRDDSGGPVCISNNCGGPVCISGGSVLGEFRERRSEREFRRSKTGKGIGWRMQGSDGVAHWGMIEDEPVVRGRAVGRGAEAGLWPASGLRLRRALWSMARQWHADLPVRASLRYVAGAGGGRVLQQ